MSAHSSHRPQTWLQLPQEPARRDAPPETSSGPLKGSATSPASLEESNGLNLAPCATSLCPSQGWAHTAGIGGSSAKPQHEQLQIKRGRQSWHRAPALPNPVCHNQVNVPACAQTQCAPPALRDIPLPASPPSPVPQSHPLLALLAWGQSPAPECQGWGRRAVLGGQGA